MKDADHPLWEEGSMPVPISGTLIANLESPPSDRHVSRVSHLHLVLDAPAPPKLA